MSPPVDDRRIHLDLLELAGREVPPDLTGRVLAARRERLGAPAPVPRASAASPWRSVLIAAALVGVAALLGRAFIDPQPVDPVDPAAAPDAPQFPLRTAVSAQELAGLAGDTRRLMLTGVTDSWLPHLARLRNVTELYIFRGSSSMDMDAPGAELLTDAAWPAIARLGKLQRLQIMLPGRARGDGIKALQTLPLLTSIEIGMMALSPTACGELAALPTVTQLWLKQCPLTDAHWEQLEKMRGLRSFGLSYCSVSQSTLLRFVRRTRISSLSVESGRLTDRFLDDLVGARLTGLSLLKCGELTPEAAVSLARMTSLTRLHVEDSRAWESGDWSFLDGMKDLRQLRLGALPGEDTLVLDPDALRRQLGNPNLRELELRSATGWTKELVAALGRSGVERLSLPDNRIPPPLLEDLCARSRARIVLPDRTVRKAPRQRVPGGGR